MPQDTPDVLVVDDDPIVGQLTLNLLKEAGLKATLTSDSEEVISFIQKAPPKLVILDVMMPGVDGITLLNQIKSDPAVQNIKVVMLSGKSFAVEKQRAYKLGADLFIEKPYDIQTFANQIISVIKGGGPKGMPLAPKAPPQPQETKSEYIPPQNVRIRIWGCRGLSPSIPSQPSRYGYQTSCVSVETPHGMFILDAGSGIIPLGHEILKRGGPKELWILMTHFHLDHVLGLGVFPCAQRAGYKIHIGGANDPEKNLQGLIQEVFYGSFSSFSQPPKAEIDLYELQEDFYDLIPNVKLSTLYSNHPTTTLCFKLEMKGKKIVYCPDSEIYGEEATALQDYDEKLANFCEGADILIHNAQFTEEDYEKHKKEGHSCPTNVLELAAERAQVKEVVLFHHDASYSDEALDWILANSQKLINQKKWKIQCQMAKEGLAIEL
ncbi:MAG: response regulator [Elusimicrobia bacterium]|nr:response regulator [Elusimicrobiota bacterium]